MDKLPTQREILTKAVESIARQVQAIEFLQQQVAEFGGKLYQLEVKLLAVEKDLAQTTVKTPGPPSP